MNSQREINEMIGKRIRQVRTIRGISQETLSRSMNQKYRGWVSLIESGKKGTSLHRLVRLAKVLHVPASCWLLEEERWETFITVLTTENKVRQITKSEAQERVP